MLATEEQVILEEPSALLEEYRKTNNIELRNQLVLHYSYIAKTVAMQMRGISSNYAQLEDIVNQGILTLIDCIERFDPAKGVKFESYAFMRIRGAVIDFVRKQDWLPRRVRKTAKDIAAAQDQLSNQLMREPTNRELADYLEISEDALNKHYSEISNSVMLSFEGIIQNTVQTGPSLDSLYDEESMPEQSIFKQELKATLMEAIDNLTERERLVVSLYYYEHLKFNHISQVLGVSESRICQIHSKAILKLKNKMESYMRG